MNIRRQNMSTDLRIKILNNLRGAPRRIDARRLLMQKRQFSRRLKNYIQVSRPGLTREVNVPFLIPRRTIPLTRQWSSSAISTSRPLTRTVENKPTGAGMLAQGSTVDSTISPIQGFRVEAKNLLPSVTIDDVYSAQLSILKRIVVIMFNVSIKGLVDHANSQLAVHQSGFQYQLGPSDYVMSTRLTTVDCNNHDAQCHGHRHLRSPLKGDATSMP
ncbi:hypothetical protein EGR_08935 [Echinococcus granulosus]|uniref:Uncharacterized protein n=1 Tax=Echinococcus granulosus TaxID=6210 RepID=W6UD09_ECHGR|nr:hypothetical protein EGR_08935 [Echinococcus granulosus]EUB56187.1 hypothetical protein EGR_08935 [Echinococcus granulosus]